MTFVGRFGRVRPPAMNVRTSTRCRRERAAVPSARAYVRHALRSAGAPADTLDRLVLAVAEACNNAILHAGGDVFTVSVVVEGSRAMVAVADASGELAGGAVAVLVERVKQARLTHRPPTSTLSGTSRQTRSIRT